MSTANTDRDAWTALVLTGVVSIIFGVAAVFWPGLTLLTLVYLFSAYVLVIGIITSVKGIMSIGKSTWWYLRVILGVFELGVGVYLLRHVNVSFATFILLIGFSLIARGVIDVVETFFETDASATVRTLTFIVGLAALLAGIIILFQPVAGGVAFVWILGLYALVAGTMEIALAVDAHHVLAAQETPKRSRR
jgi:uncharacterized membrane protein HdeD (DUF308 family)